MSKVEIVGERRDLLLKLHGVDPRNIRNRYPQPGGQTAFLLSPAQELLGGGQAGGGKSHILCVDALGLQYQASLGGRACYQIPNYRAVIFRRESVQLSHLLDEARTIYPLMGARFTAQRRGDPGPCYEWDTEDPYRPARIYFSHLESPQDVENHQGQEYQFVGFDELTQFLLSQYLYLFSRMRQAADPRLVSRMRSTTNPTGPGLWWVKKRFIKGLKPRLVNWFIADVDPEINPQGIRVPYSHPFGISREFIPMSLEENLVLMKNDPLYATRIMQLGDKMARALLKGDWDAFGGDFFAEFDYGAEVVEPRSVPKSWKLVGSIDPGFSSPCSFGLTAADPSGNVHRVATYYERQRNPEQHARAIRDFIKTCRPTGGRWPDVIVSGHDAWAKKDKYSVIASNRTFADEFASEGVHLSEAALDRHNGWWSWKALLPRRYFVYRGLNEALLEEMTGVVADEKDPEDIQGKGNDPAVKDHALDEQRYGIMALELPDIKEQVVRWEDVWFGRARHPAVPKAAKGWKPGRG